MFSTLAYNVNDHKTEVRYYQRNINNVMYSISIVWKKINIKCQKDKYLNLNYKGG